VKRVLVLCTGNSCRSQMAEGYINRLLGDRWEARSAGTRPAERVHPLAVRAMAEIGIDIAHGRPDHVDAYVREPWDLVVTVCDPARETCPWFPRPVERLHVSFDDPAGATGGDAERMAVFRRVRDEIRERLLPELERRA
jgi:arsenate reductase (thioredoxin)